MPAEHTIRCERRSWLPKTAHRRRDPNRPSEQQFGEDWV